MSLYGLLTTSASGMSAQSTLLGTVADNIANVNTAGYKSGSAEFASMVLAQAARTFNREAFSQRRASRSRGRAT